MRRYKACVAAAEFGIAMKRLALVMMKCNNHYI